MEKKRNRKFQFESPPTTSSISLFGLFPLQPTGAKLLISMSRDGGLMSPLSPPFCLSSGSQPTLTHAAPCPLEKGVEYAGRAAVRRPIHAVRSMEGARHGEVCLGGQARAAGRRGGEMVVQQLFWRPPHVDRCDIVIFAAVFGGRSMASSDLGLPYLFIVLKCYRSEVLSCLPPFEALGGLLILPLLARIADLVDCCSKHP